MNKGRKPAKTSTRTRSSAPAVSPRVEPKATNSHRRRKSDGAGSRTAKSEGGVAAVDRALEILASFEPTDKALTLAELAQRTVEGLDGLCRLTEHRVPQDADR